MMFVWDNLKRVVSKFSPANFRRIKKIVSKMTSNAPKFLSTIFYEILLSEIFHFFLLLCYSRRRKLEIDIKYVSA